MKNYVFGDTGGHMKQLFASLRAIGIDPNSGTIPDNVRIIHLGDLIHKGPHSSLLLDKINTLILNNPGQWIQLLGNHEFQHIEGSPYFWNCSCSIQDVGIINDWFEEGLATATYALPAFTEFILGVSKKRPINVPDKGILFSHAGLTWGWWNSFNKNTDVVKLSQELNQQDVWVITAAGEMLGLFGRDPGPVWAIGNSEVFDSWQAHPDIMPFTQIHGHTTSFIFSQNKWFIPPMKKFNSFKTATKLNPETRAVITYLAGNVLVGIDPGYSKNADNDSQPFLTIKTLN